MKEGNAEGEEKGQGMHTKAMELYKQKEGQVEDVFEGRRRLILGTKQAKKAMCNILSFVPNLPMQMGRT